MLAKDYSSLKIGDVYSVNYGGTVTIIRIINYDRIVIQHNDNFKYTTTVSFHNLKNGECKNPYYPLVCGVGYLGVGSHLTYENGRKTKTYNIWQGMLARCYGANRDKLYPTYANVTVDERWFNFQNFAEWYNNHPDFDKGYELDKDLLKPGNTVYGPDTCCMVPKYINNLICTQKSIPKSGARGVTFTKNLYMVKGADRYLGYFPTLEDAKERYTSFMKQYIRDKANEWKPLIQEDVYLALIKYSENM